MQSAIPPELEAEVMARSAQGQSDAAIVDWLARLDPPIHVHRTNILRLRQRLAGLTETTPAEPTAPHKPSGAQGRKARTAQAASEAADQAKRGAVIIEPDRDLDAETAHLDQLRLLAAYQEAVRTDKLMTLPEKLRFTVAIGQTMAKLKVDAEIQAKQDQIRKDLAARYAQLDAARTELEREQRRLAAERRELAELRAQLNARP